MSPEHGTAAHIPSSSSSSFSHTTDVALPHGGELKDLIFRDSAVRSQLIAEAKDLQSLVLTERHLCDLELIMNGGFSPLDGFMTQTEYEGVVEEMRLPGSGLLWSIPITLDVSDQQVETMRCKQQNCPWIHLFFCLLLPRLLLPRFPLVLDYH